MLQFGAFEGKNNFGKLLDLAEAGEEIVITRHGRPVAVISGTTQRTPEQIEEARSAVARIRKRATERKTGPFVWEEWKAYRDEGRK
ncbi:MAG TPA: type II toxin-antitoxin system prevent-host-death family antitoxin [Terracidiphilus sp.]|jgi:prevent-host-death family protein